MSTRRTRARSKIPGAPHAQDAVGCRRRGNRSQAQRERKWRRQQGVGGSEEESRTSCLQLQDLLLQLQPVEQRQAPISEKGKTLICQFVMRAVTLSLRKIASTSLIY